MLRLRPYRDDDREACLRILDSNVPEYFMAGDRDEAAAFLDSLAAKGIRYLVVEDDDEVLACGGVAISEEKDARMCWGMVRRDRHRTGVGRTLLAARLVMGAELGAKTASLATVPAAEGFFAKLGFELAGSVEDHYGPGWDRRDYRIVLDTEAVTRLRALLP